MTRCAGRRSCRRDAAAHACTMRGGVIRSRPPPPCPPQLPTATVRDRAPELPAQIGKYRGAAPSSAKARPARSSSRHDDFHQRDVAIKRVRSGLALDTPEGALPAALLRRRGGARRPAAAPERGADLRRGATTPRRTYLVMEYVAGVTLRRFCRADALLSLEQVVEIGFKCAMALGYVYRQGLIHRDVKPANLLATLHNGTGHRRQDHRLRQRLNLQSDAHAGLPRRLAGLHVARAARRRRARLPRRHLLAGRACCTT